MPGDSVVGSALRENGGDTLRQYLSTLSPEQLPLIAERIVQLDTALDYNSMRHTPDLQSLLTVADAAGGVALQGDEDGAEQRWAESLRSVAATIPGRDHEGNVVSRYKLYAQEAQANPYDVTAAAKEALMGPNTSPEDREYWQQQVRNTVPELATTVDIIPEMIPDSTVAQDLADSHFEALGKAAGQMMQSLTGSSQPQKGSSESILTDTPVAPEAAPEPVEESITMADVPVAEAVDHSTPDYVDGVLPDGSVREA